MAEDFVMFCRHQGDAQLPGAPQRIDDEMLGVALMLFVAERRLGQATNRFDILRAFVAQGHVQRFEIHKYPWSSWQMAANVMGTSLGCKVDDAG